MPVNYQKMLEQTLRAISATDQIPTLLLHSCCGPCSSTVLEYLSAYFAITVLYYNPNIYPQQEFDKRAAAQRQLLLSMECRNPVAFVLADYGADEFDEAVSGFEAAPEGGARCLKCFELRLGEAAKYARDNGFDYFTTTLSVSPHKDAAALNNIGGALAEKYGTRYLYADFKKRNGYKRSVELSEQFGLYRQNYCGCKYSMRRNDTIQPHP